MDNPSVSLPRDDWTLIIKLLGAHSALGQTEFPDMTNMERQRAERASQRLSNIENEIIKQIGST